MTLKLEYDPLVKRLNPATVAVLALALFVPAVLAQGNGVPASVTSTGFGGSVGPRGTAPTVTSPRFGAPANHAPIAPPSATALGSRNNPGFVSRPAPKPSHHHPHDGDHHPRGGAVYAVPYYYPYAYDGGEPYSAGDATNDNDSDEEYQGGPTIFDRRGAGTSATQESYAEQAPGLPAAAGKEVKEIEEGPVSNQPDTLLIFKDGHQVAVSNYAIVGTRCSI